MVKGGFCLILTSAIGDMLLARTLPSPLHSLSAPVLINFEATGSQEQTGINDAGSTQGGKMSNSSYVENIPLTHYTIGTGQNNLPL